MHACMYICISRDAHTPYCVLLYNILQYIAILQYLTRCYVTTSLKLFLFLHTVSVESNKQAIQFES